MTFGSTSPTHRSIPMATVTSSGFSIKIRTGNHPKKRSTACLRKPLRDSIVTHVPRSMAVATSVSIMSIHSG